MLSRERKGNSLKQSKTIGFLFILLLKMRIPGIGKFLSGSSTVNKKRFFSSFFRFILFLFLAVPRWLMERTYKQLPGDVAKQSIKPSATPAKGILNEFSCWAGAVSNIIVMISSAIIFVKRRNVFFLWRVRLLWRKATHSIVSNPPADDFSYVIQW